MSTTDARPSRHHPPRGALGYLQLPTTDLGASIAFYESVLGWRGEATYGSFEAPGLIGQWTTDLAPTTDGPMLWFTVEDLFPTLARVAERGGTVRGNGRSSTRASAGWSRSMTPQATGSASSPWPAPAGRRRC